MDGHDQVGYDAAMRPYDTGAQTSQQPSPRAPAEVIPRLDPQSVTQPASAQDARPDELASLREQFPGFRIWREITVGRVRYVARRTRAGLNPHTVVTDNVAELRAALDPSRDSGQVLFSSTAPSIARMYDFLLGGKDNYAVDRSAAGKILDAFPEAAHIARANRAFLARAVRHAARQGISQFIDLGSGLPTKPNIHETARQITPGARTAYIDRDEFVLAYARALLAVDEQVAVIAADIRDPAAILTSPALTNLIDLTQPVCLLLVSVLHFLPSGEADTAVAAYRDRIAPGSYLVISAGTSTGTDPQLIVALRDAYAQATPVTGRTEAEIAAWFDGLTFARPGLVEVQAWRPGSAPHPAPLSQRARFLAGVARKPAPASPDGSRDQRVSGVPAAIADDYPGWAVTHDGPKWIA
jgi:O-methyltransferase involved in polyketide biosynthesis